MSDADVSWWVRDGRAGRRAELIERGRRVLIVDQEKQNIGGRLLVLRWAVLVDSPEQRGLAPRQSRVALLDWLGSAGFDRERTRAAAVGARLVDSRPVRAQLVARAWLQTFAMVGWANAAVTARWARNRCRAQHHLGHGPALVDVFARRCTASAGQVLPTARVDGLIVEGGAVVGVRGAVLEPATPPRGGDVPETPWASSISGAGQSSWPAAASRQPRAGPQELATRMVGCRTAASGVPATSTAGMIGISETAAAVINSGRNVLTPRHHQLDPICRSTASGSCPGRPRVAGRHGKSVRCRCTRFRSPGTLEYITNTGSTTPGSCSCPHHRQEFRAVRAGTEPGSDRAQCQAGARRAAAAARCGSGGCRTKASTSSAQPTLPSW